MSLPRNVVDGAEHTENELRDPLGGAARSLRLYWERYFPRQRITTPDCTLAGALLLVVYFAFYHGDMFATGWDSLNYLFGNPLDFYENCRKNRPQGLFYPPTTYAVFALWFFPLKLLGIIKSASIFSPGLVYWAKALTTLLYLISGLVFYKVTRLYSDDRNWGKYATALWLTMPFAVFSQFIFSGYDIFHVLLALIGFFLFLRARPFAAAACFGLAITFKYFPTFAFLPLLLLFEKKLGKLLTSLAIFIAPTVLVHLLYQHSPIFVETVVNYGLIDRVYADSMSVGSGWQVYWLFAAFAVLCVFAYMADIERERLPRVAAYVYLLGSIFPFLFIVWHPQWMMCIAPALTLTTVLNKKANRFFLLDLIAMLLFVGFVSDQFADNVDGRLFHGSVFGLEFEDSYKMFKLFWQFKDHSAFVFLSCFWGYLAAQLLWKSRSLRSSEPLRIFADIDYNNVRWRFFGGLLIFLLPATMAIYKDVGGRHRVATNDVAVSNYGELTKGRTFGQSFMAREPRLDEIDLFLATFSRHNSGTITVSVVDGDNRILADTERPAGTVGDNLWNSFKFDHIRVVKGATYRIRLSSSTAQAGNAITWWASDVDRYPNGVAIVDGVPRANDFAFRVVFSK